jgi:hypothetical protein
MSIEESVASLVERQTDRFYGKYRGLVLINADPLSQGRIKALVPEVLGLVPSTWALPCTPYAGVGAGLFTIPPPGAGVWIEFEAGDPSRPVWSGCWWGAGQIPLNEQGLPSQFTSRVLRSDAGLLFSISDMPPTITISDPTGKQQAITLRFDAGSTEIRSPAFVILEAPQIRHGIAAVQHAVHGEELMAYLTTLVGLFNTHVHPGQTAIGILPVTPAPPLGFFTLPPPTMLSVKVTVE